MVRAVCLFVVVGCWSGPQPTGPAALLRRHHEPGDVLHVCERGDGTITIAGMEPITMVLRTVREEHMLDRQSHKFVVRHDTISGSARMFLGQKPQQTVMVTDRTILGTPIDIDDRNRTLGVVFTEPEAVDTDQASVGSSPYPVDIVGITFPERAIRQNETFPLEVKRRVQHADAMPSQLVLDLTFTVTRVTPDHVELACKGTQVEQVRRGKSFIRCALDVTCRARIDRRDGRTSQWSIDGDGTYDSSERKPGDSRVVHARSHYDVTVGASDTGVCDRAKEP